MGYFLFDAERFSVTAKNVRFRAAFKRRVLGGVPISGLGLLLEIMLGLISLLFALYSQAQWNACGINVVPGTQATCYGAGVP